MSAETPHSQDSSATILVVEDDATVRSVLTRMLRSFGYEVMEADSLEQTSSRLDDAEQVQRQIDLFVVDVRIEGSDLESVLGELRRRSPASRLMLTSGYPAEELAEQGLVVDRREFLEKPFRMEELRARVAELLG